MKDVGELQGEIKFPDEWYTAPWDKCELISVLKIKGTGEQMFYAGGTLEDGTCIYGLGFPGGQRVMRLCPSTGWALEERFRGTPKKSIRREVNDVWCCLVQSIVVAKQMTEDELGPPATHSKGER